ncbi:hypothetical protein PCASD_19621 [Puccinia coronata f. sp. avenae]|uniref:Cwf19-like C-terminal domain-containing protein n=1 Tax=Puccinia coronata f. sp. avenae TaxID=200324 RepID=A0A2N5TTW0_9BASI|nr:hypothetical protein PCASD_19621 [Puccinia coronata f. sp. avenae]
MAKGKDQATSGKEKEKESKHRSSKKKHKQQKRKVDQEQDESDEWVEKEAPVETSVPVPVSELPDPTTTTSDGQDMEGESSTRESRMASQDKAAAPEGIQDEDDYLNRMGTLVSSRANKEKDIQAKAVQKEFQPQSSSSIKRLGADDPKYQPNAQPMQTPIIPGGPGYQWRLTKLRRTYDTAQEENRFIEEVALERYGTMEAWEQANKEQRILEEDIREGPSSTSRPNSRASFRKSTSALNTPEGGRQLGINKRVEEIRARPSASNPVSPSSSSSGPFTPIPSVINPLANRASLHSANKAPANTTTLNKLQASIMKAKIMDPDAVPELKRQYKEALDSHRSNSSATEQTIELVPSLDARGRMYDIGAGAEEDDASSFKPGNKRKKEAKFAARDLKTGELLRFNPDDDQITLGQARWSDKRSSRQARRTRKTSTLCPDEESVRDVRVLFQDDGGPPANLGIISRGTKVYLSCMQFEELVDGHCWIIPMQHCLSSLKLDDDVWDEIKNYMKCLMKMFAEKHDKGVVFYKTMLSFKYQRHTERPGGFRCSMVSQLPYFMIQWDYRGEKGFGHVIEGDDNHPGSSKADPGVDGDHTSIVDDGLKGTKFPR